MVKLHIFSRGMSLVIASLCKHDSHLVPCHAYFLCLACLLLLLLLQKECGTVPANPFPEPINGKAIAMWQHVKDVAVPEARVECANLVGWGTPAMAGVAQAAAAAKLAAAHKAKRARAGATYTGVAKATPAGGSGSDAGQEQEEDDFFSEPPSRPVLLGGYSEGSKGMRQESYYLRGVIDEGRDKKMLATIADCIPGTYMYGNHILFQDNGIEHNTSLYLPCWAFI